MVDMFGKKQPVKSIDLILKLDDDPCQHINACSFHENAPKFCPDCGKYIDGGKVI